MHVFIFFSTLGMNDGEFFLSFSTYCYSGDHCLSLLVVPVFFSSLSLHYDSLGLPPNQKPRRRRCVFSLLLLRWRNVSIFFFSGEQCNVFSVSLMCARCASGSWESLHTHTQPWVTAFFYFTSLSVFSLQLMIMINRNCLWEKLNSILSGSWDDHP